MTTDPRASSIVRQSRLSRRSAVRLFGLGVVGLLAACSSQSSTGSNSSATTSTTSNTGGSSATTAAPAASTTTSSSGAAASPAAGAAATPSAAAVALKKGGTVTIAVDQEPPTLDPHASPSAITFYLTASAGESLTYLTPDHQLKPWLADSWEATPDGKSYTFKLRKDVKFQDGTTFSAQSVKWNFDRVVDPSYKAGAALGNLSGYSGTDTPDDATAKVNFKNPFAPFLTYSASAFLPMLSADATKAQGDAVNTTPVMSGPYKFTEYVAKDHATMTRWDGYTRRAPWSDHDGAGYLDKVIWKFVPEAGTRTTTVESGETQVATVIPAQDLPRFQSSKDYTVVNAVWVGVPLLLLLTVDKAPTDDLKVRQAILYGTNLDEYVDTLYKGTGQKASGPLAASLLDDPSLHNLYPYDQNKAKQLLDDAGWKAGSGGVRQKNGQNLEFVLNAIDYGGGPDPLSVLFQGQMQKIGMDVKIKSQARPPFYDDAYKGTDNGTSLFLRYGDYDALYALFHSSNIGGNFNWARLNDPDVDKMLQQGREELDPNKRKAIYVALEKKLLDLAVCVPLIDQWSVWVLRSNVSGLKFTGFTYPVVSDLGLKS